jgi:hypothetical protein
LHKYLDFHPSYVALYDISEPVRLLRETLQRLRALRGTQLVFHSSLMQREKLAEVVLLGREALLQNELAIFGTLSAALLPPGLINHNSPSRKLLKQVSPSHAINPSNFVRVNWLQALSVLDTQFMDGLEKEKLVTDSCSQWWANFEHEKTVICHELRRRHIVQELFAILCTESIVGHVDIDVHVDESLLRDQMISFNNVVQAVEILEQESVLLRKPFDDGTMNAKLWSLCSIPLNLQALLHATSLVLTLRTEVFHAKWDSHSLSMCLSALQSNCSHGGALSVSVVQKEQEKVQDELFMRQCVRDLRQALEDVRVRHVEGGKDRNRRRSLMSTSHQVDLDNEKIQDSAVSSLDHGRRRSITTRVEVDLLSLRSAMCKTLYHNRLSMVDNSQHIDKLNNDISPADLKHCGAVTQRLILLAQSVIRLTDMLIANKLDQIPEGSTEKIHVEYVAMNLQSMHVDTIFEHIHMHHFLKHCSHILVEKQEQPKTMLDQLLALKNSVIKAEKAVIKDAVQEGISGEQFAPYLTISLLFCEVSSALYLDRNWVAVTEACRRLDEYLEKFVTPMVSIMPHEMRIMSMEVTLLTIVYFGLTAGIGARCSFHAEFP